MIKSEVLVPLLNANEPEARVVAIHIKDGQAVEKGTLLFTLETTKAAAEVEAPESGFIRVLAKEGDILAVGDKLAYITEIIDEPLPQVTGIHPSAFILHPSPLRITKPARALAESLGVDLSKLPTDRLVTEEAVRQFAGDVAAPVILISQSTQPQLLIYGGGGHAKAVMEMAQAMGIFHVAGIIDDKIPAGTEVLGIPVLGTRAVLPQVVAQGVRLAANGVGGIIDINIRVQVFELLEHFGFDFPSLLHPRATLEPSAEVGQGVQVFANAYVGSSSVLHPRCMVNTGAVVSHDCEIGTYSHIAPGALLAGLVHVGERTLIGMGVTTAIGIRIGNGVRIGNGAILLADVPDRNIIQAGRLWTGKTATP